MTVGCFHILIFSAQRNNWTETLRSHSGWIIAPDRDEDNLYDFNLNYKWIIEGNASTDVVLLKPVYFIIENSPDCSADFVSVSTAITRILRMGIFYIFTGY